jgi:hypothetical protein
VEPNPEDIANGIKKFYEQGESHFIPNIVLEKKKYRWSTLVSALMNLPNNTSPNDLP